MSRTARSTIGRAAVMRAAWAMFRERYSFPRIAFKAIGRKCFAYCLKVAWDEEKQAALGAAIPIESKARLAVSLHRQLDDLQFTENCSRPRPAAPPFLPSSHSLGRERAAGDNGFAMRFPGLTTCNPSGGEIANG